METPEKCKKHPRYKALQQPRVYCKPCIALWEAALEKRRANQSDLEKQLRSSERVQKILDFLEITIDDALAENEPQDLNLDKDNGKPYYVKCYWESDYNGSFCDKDDIIGLMSDIIRHGHEDNFTIQILDIEQNIEVEASILDIEIG